MISHASMCLIIFAWVCLFYKQSKVRVNIWNQVTTYDVKIQQNLLDKSLYMLGNVSGFADGRGN